MHPQVQLQTLDPHILEKQPKLLYTLELSVVLNVLQVLTHVILITTLK